MNKKQRQGELRRGLGLFSATAPVVANMEGTGIFATSGFIIEESGDPETLPGLHPGQPVDHLLLHKILAAGPAVGYTIKFKRKRRDPEGL